VTRQTVEGKFYGKAKGTIRVETVVRFAFPECYLQKTTHSVKMFPERGLSQAAAATMPTPDSMLRTAFHFISAAAS
jgi:hypothetical protein